MQKPDCQVKSNGDALGSDVEVEDLELTVQHRELWIQGEAIHRGKVKDVEGEVVVPKQASGAAQRLWQGARIGKGSGATENARVQPGASARRPFRLKGRN